MMNHIISKQMDLFFTPKRRPPLRPELREKLAPLLQALLTEAAGIALMRDREGGDDQDHA